MGNAHLKLDDWLHQTYVARNVLSKAKMASDGEGLMALDDVALLPSADQPAALRNWLEERSDAPGKTEK